MAGLQHMARLQRDVLKSVSQSVRIVRQSMLSSSYALHVIPGDDASTKDVRRLKSWSIISRSCRSVRRSAACSRLCRPQTAVLTFHLTKLLLDSTIHLVLMQATRRLDVLNGQLSTANLRCGVARNETKARHVVDNDPSCIPRLHKRVM